MSRFLTKPWEFGKRRLWYFDFADDQVHHAPSRRLFATVGLNPAHVERRLNEVIERPISGEMDRLLGQHDGQESDLEWPLFRAVVLLMMLQASRGGRPERIEQVVMKTDQELDDLARAVGREYRVGRISVRRDAALLYPAAGYFVLPVRNQDGRWESAIAIPAGLHYVFVAVPRAVDWDVALQMWSRNGAGAVSNASVGLSSKVVLPPGHRAATSDHEIARNLNQMRRDNDQLVALIRQMNAVLNSLAAAYGSTTD